MSDGKYIIYGAGNVGKMAIDCLNSDNIRFFIDENKEKQANGFNGYDVYSIEDAMEFIDDDTIVVAVSDKFSDEIIEQLEKHNINKYKTFNELFVEENLKKINERVNYIDIYTRAVEWIKNNTIEGKGINNSSITKKAYPEVTGYYIPTLLKWGYRELAIQYAKWLCDIQKEDGSWYDTDDLEPYVFDSAQILKGLIAIRDILPNVDSNIIKGCDWLISNIDEDGRFHAVNENCFNSGNKCSELIHIYALEPIYKVGKIFGEKKYSDLAKKSMKYYIDQHLDEILDFNLVSHFYAYVMEGLVDMGEIDVAKTAMNKIALLQRKDGSVPGYRDVNWVCSTGLFQLAIVWFKLGEYEKGNNAFQYACKLQNQTGGWFGSYLHDNNLNEKNTYFPLIEISWANKYFLDALYYKNECLFEVRSDGFQDNISFEDGLYISIRNSILDYTNEYKFSEIKILDLGCGKGRYLKNLREDNIIDKSRIQFYATDISKKVMNYIGNQNIIKKVGSLTNIPYQDNFFDVVYTCEALEHSVDIASAIKEMARVTKSGGKVIIIDKNRSKLGTMLIEEWEQWFDIGELKAILLRYCKDVQVMENINCSTSNVDDLFVMWVGTV